jgi:hypothetical protein
VWGDLQDEHKTISEEMDRAREELWREHIIIANLSVNALRGIASSSSLLLASATGPLAFPGVGVVATEMLLLIVSAGVVVPGAGVEDVVVGAGVEDVVVGAGVVDVVVGAGVVDVLLLVGLTVTLNSS